MVRNALNDVESILVCKHSNMYPSALSIHVVINAHVARYGGYEYMFIFVNKLHGRHQWINHLIHPGKTEMYRNTCHIW